MLTTCGEATARDPLLIACSPQENQLAPFVPPNSVTRILLKHAIIPESPCNGADAETPGVVSQFHHQPAKIMNHQGHEVSRSPPFSVLPSRPLVTFVVNDFESCDMTKSSFRS